MTKTFTALLLVAFAMVASVSSFTPSAAFSPRSSSTAMSMSEDSKKSATTNELVIDENFENVELERLLGKRRLKKKMRRYKTQLNEKIRNGDVVQDDNGDWVPKEG
eukprot:CAMPEP_0185723258 /NCGR_PEP_ID=MMETSP1171-20130828/158_1 /TAXON_ID=374046 /ORGANISM="Helicotheca tamensis, Strain CCMP826" /LENGTH=105 /DNA_ID=CAMNT_0028390929 /DNA_START=54 /DNA_END=371 /DNA_ORIENTATION=+